MERNNHQTWVNLNHHVHEIDTGHQVETILYESIKKRINESINESINQSMNHWNKEKNKKNKKKPDSGFVSKSFGSRSMYLGVSNTFGRLENKRYKRTDNAMERETMYCTFGND